MTFLFIFLVWTQIARSDCPPWNYGCNMAETIEPLYSTPRQDKLVLAQF